MSNLLGNAADLENFEPTIATLAANLGVAGVQNVVNVSEVGQLYSIGIGGTVTSFGSLAATLEIQIDGQTTQSTTLFSAGALNAALWIAFAPLVSGAGVYYPLHLPFSSRYAASLRVGINITVTTSGTLYLGVTRGRRY